MASEKTPPAPAPGAPNKSKRTLIIALLVVVLLVVLAGVGALVFALKASHSDDADDEEDVAEKVVKTKKKGGSHDLPPVFVKLDRFTVNLKSTDDGSGEGYTPAMQAEITLQVDDAEADARLKALMPRVRNDMTLIMSDRQAGELANREGKEKLAVDIKNALNAIVGTPSKNRDAPPDGPVDDVLFESIIIQ